MRSLKDEQWEGGYRFWSERTSQHSSREEARPRPADARKSEAGHHGEDETEAEVARGRAWSEVCANHSDSLMHGLRGVPIIVIALCKV